VNSVVPEAFLFDLDGTLVDSERENIESVVLAARRHGAELTEEERQFVIGHSWNEIYEMVARDHGLAVPMTQLIAEAVAEKRALLARSGHRALPGAVSAVQRFARTSKLAIVTGASTAEARDAIDGIGISRSRRGAGRRRDLRPGTRRPIRTRGDRAARRQRARSSRRGRRRRNPVARGPRRARHRRARRQLRRLRPVARGQSSSTRWTTSPTSLCARLLS
jgi:phosphoserine phosphatase